MGARDAWGGYRDHQHPHTLMYLPLRGMSSPNEYRQHLDQLDLVGVTPLDMSIRADQSLL
jgi:hypothetical protein